MMKLKLMMLLSVLMFLVGLNIADAQEKVFLDKNQLQKADVENNILQNYIKISSIPMNERRKFFNDFSSEDKANIFKLHLALQFAKRSNLTKEQKTVILEGISLTTPDTYDQENFEKLAKIQQKTMEFEQKAKLIFPGQEGFEIFANVGGGREDIEILQKYQDVVSLSSIVDRKDSFRTASVTEKSNLWKVQFALHLAKNSSLTKEQREFILQMIAFVTPEIFEYSLDNPEQKDLNEMLQKFSTQALNLFSKEKGFEIFAVLAQNQEDLLEAKNLTSLRQKPACEQGRKTLNYEEFSYPTILVSFASGRKASPALKFQNCGCSYGSGFTCGTFLCMYCSSAIGCTETESGCGFLWRYPCDGVCRYC